MPERTHGETMRQLASIVDILEAAGHDVHDAGVIDGDEGSPPAVELGVTLDPTAGPQPDAPGIQAVTEATDQSADAEADEPQADDSPDPTADTPPEVDTDTDPSDGEPESDPTPAAGSETALDSDDGEEPIETPGGVVYIEEVPEIGDKIAHRLRDAEYPTAGAVRDADPSELSEIPYIGRNRVKEIKDAVDNLPDTAGEPGVDPAPVLEDVDHDIQDAPDGHLDEREAETDAEMEESPHPDNAQAEWPSEDASGDDEEATTDGGQLTSDPVEVDVEPGDTLGTAEVDRPYHRTRFPIPERALEYLGHPSKVSVVPEGSDDKLALAAGTGWDDVHISYDVDDEQPTIGTVGAAGVGVTDGATVTFHVSDEIDGAVSMRRASAGQPTTPEGGERR